MLYPICYLHRPMIVAIDHSDVDVKVIGKQSYQISARSVVPSELDDNKVGVTVIAQCSLTRDVLVSWYFENIAKRAAGPLNLFRRDHFNKLPHEVCYWQSLLLAGADWMLEVGSSISLGGYSSFSASRAEVSSARRSS